MIQKHFTLLVLLLVVMLQSFAANWYFHPAEGDDQNMGTSTDEPFRKLAKIADLTLTAGDTLFLYSRVPFNEPLILEGLKGQIGHEIVVMPYGDKENETKENATIDAAGWMNGILLKNCSGVKIQNISVHANGYKSEHPQEGNMRCGVLVTATEPGDYGNITLSGLDIYDVFYETPGFNRGTDEVRTANGTQNYGWGIRFINNAEGAMMSKVKLTASRVHNVAHTGLKFTSYRGGIRDVEVSGCRITRTGGPGIQMSGLVNGHFHHNKVNYSGSTDDSRKWGRGSGLWTWNSDSVIIEHNEFRNANGPGDSAGCHIDFHCNNIIVQYNISENNAGGFIEVLGNNYNCAYRFNISINDGHRVKGENGAFQEGKVFWLSGYQGSNSPRKGPFNSYFYNNTIFVDESIEAKFAVAPTAEGVMIVNNIFYIAGNSSIVTGDQFKPDDVMESALKNYFVSNNLFLKAENWPLQPFMPDNNLMTGNPEFQNAGGNRASDYIPKNMDMVAGKGIQPMPLKGDSTGLFTGMQVEYDILGNPLKNNYPLGAIVP